MPRTLKLLLLAGTLAAPPCALAAAQTDQQKPAAAQTAASAEDDFERGKRLLAQGDAQGAAAVLKRAAERRKTDADAWYQLGLALNVSGNMKDARKAFEKAVKLRSDSAETRAGLAYTLLYLNKTGDAEREAKRALALDAKTAVAHFVLGATQSLAGKYARAAQEAEEALKLQANFPAAASLLGDALLKLYAAESTRINELYPMPPEATEETRKPVFEKRQVALEPFSARMRAAADQLEALANSRPGASSSRELLEMSETLHVYSDAARARTAQVFRQAEVTTRALITYKPEPSFTEKAREKNVDGVVRLRAVLASDGRIKHILVIKGLPYGLTENAVEAARQIRFTPATLEGRPVSQFVILEYNFNVY